MFPNPHATLCWERQAAGECGVPGLGFALAVHHPLPFLFIFSEACLVLEILLS